LLILLLLPLAGLFLAACGREPLQTQESFVFGTRVEVLVWGESNDRARGAVAEVLRDFDRLHRAYHAWQPSEVTALNEAIAAGRSHEVSKEFAALIREAQAAAAAGEHLFDPGVGRLVALWGFHDDSFKAQLPDPERLAAWLAARPSIVHLRLNGETVVSASPAVALDFGGFLKGVSLDRAAATLRAHGIANALVNIGGNVMALGSKGGKPWTVGIQHPRQAAPLAILALHDGEAIGTSGDYQRFFELDGRRYCHILDPRDGRPSGGTQAVTVLIPPDFGGGRAGMWSDVASKPLFVAGEDWRRLAGRLGVAQAMRIDASGGIVATEALQRRLQYVDPKARAATVP
jgi:thiamine biosynthesis lipoprotein